MKLNFKKDYYILGLQSCAGHDSGASILKFSLNKVPEILEISEERLSRKKYSYSLPTFRSPEDYLKTKKIIC